jgi:hypothetical protein
MACARPPPLPGLCHAKRTSLTSCRRWEVSDLLFGPQASTIGDQCRARNLFYLNATQAVIPADADATQKVG